MATSLTMSIENQIGVSNYIAPGDRAEVRAMPAAGLEYRYPFINVQSWGTQTIDADRTDHRAAERDLDRQVARTKTRRA